MGVAPLGFGRRAWLSVADRLLAVCAADARAPRLAGADARLAGLPQVVEAFVRGAVAVIVDPVASLAGSWVDRSGAIITVIARRTAQAKAVIIGVDTVGPRTTDARAPEAAGATRAACST